MRRRTKQWLLVLIFCTTVFALPNSAYSQNSAVNLPDSPSESARAKHGVQAERVVTWRSVPKDFLHDQKGIWLFPTQLAKGRYLEPTLAIAGGTAGLVFADPHAMPYFRN